MTAAELRLALAEAEKAERKEADERRASVVPRFAFAWRPSAEARRWEDILPNASVDIWCLSGTLANEAELAAVGASTERLGGSMNYYVNLATPTPRIIGGTGGGRVWIKSKRWSRDDDDMLQAQGMVAALEAFMAENPEGGDVTELMTYWGAQPRKTEGGGWSH